MTRSEKLLKLIEENPGLKVIPMVHYEVVAEDYGFWKGTFGDSSIDKYNDTYNDERIYLLSEDEEEVKDYISDNLTDDFKHLSDKEFNKIVDDEFEKIEWTKAIIVWINS